MLVLTLTLLLQTAFVPPEPGPLCGVIESEIEPDMRSHERDITSENYHAAIRSLSETLPGWIEARAERMNGEGRRAVFSGEIELAWMNSLALIEAYVLKLEAMSAPEAERESAVAAFCFFLAEVPIYD